MEAWIAALPKLRPNGSPIEHTLTAEMRKWFCLGGCDVDRITGLGVPEYILVALWNVRAARRECSK